MTELNDILDQYSGRDGALLPILHAVQKQAGHISEDAMRAIAERLNLTRAEVYGVVSFYHDFRLTRSPKPVLKICRAEACQARGVEDLMTEASVQADRSVILEATYCLGLCSVGPAALTEDGMVHARLDVDGLKCLISSLS